MRFVQSTSLLGVCVPLLFSASTTSVGEKLPKGPPWHVNYRDAKREALRDGRPVFIYFTKTY